MNKQTRNLERQVDKLLGAGGRAITLKHLMALDKLRKELATAYEKYADEDGKLTQEEMVKYDRLKKLDKTIESVVKELYKDTSAEIRASLRGVARTTADGTISLLEQQTGRKVRGIAKDLDVNKLINTEMAGLKWTERMNKSRADTIWNIQREIKAGLSQGDTYGTMAKRLKKEIDSSAGKAMQIVRTEGHRVKSQAVVESLESVAKRVKMTKTWHSSRDERTRESHLRMHGMTVPFEEDFILPDGTRTEAPGLTGVAEHDINCRCIMTVDIVRE